MSDLEFEEVPLANTCLLITDGSHFSPTPQVDGYPIVNAKDIPRGRIDLDTCTRISEKEWMILKIQNCSPSPGDVLLSKDGTIGRVVHYKEDLGVVLLSSIAIIRPNGLLTSEFLAHTLRSHLFDKQASVLQSGSALRRLILEDIKKVKVPRPPLPIQKVIAEILSTVDKTIEQTEALIAKYQQIKAGMMHDLFTRGVTPDGKLRPTRDQAPHLYKEETPLGWIPKEWECSTLGREANFLSGYAFKNHELSEEGIKVIRISNLHKPDFPYWKYNGPIKPDWVVKDGDLLFSWAGVASSIDVYLYHGETALLNQHIYNFHIPNDMKKLWIYFWLQFRLPKLREEIEGGAGQLHLTKAKIQQIGIAIPKNEELDILLDHLKAIQVQVDINEMIVEKFTMLKKGLMHDLLTGRVRVNIPEKEEV